MGLIGNAINSLPLAYAPMNGTGRYVAYALGSLASSAVAAPAASFIGDAGAASAATGGASPIAIRVTSASMAASVGAGVTVLGARNFFGAMAAATTLAISPSPIRISGTGEAMAAATAAMTNVPLRLRFGASDFTSLYSPSAERSSGEAVNTFALNMGALTGVTGQHRRVFVVTCAPTGSYVVDAPLTLPALSEQTPTGSAFFVGALSAAASLATQNTPNAVFGPEITTPATLNVSPFSMALRAGVPGFNTVTAGATFSGALFAGAQSSAVANIVLAAIGGAIWQGGLSVSVTSVMAVLATLLAGGESETALTSTLDAIARRLKIGYMTGAGLAVATAKPHYPFNIEESIVYAVNYDTDLETDTIVSQVYAVGFDTDLEVDVHEDTVYRPTRESIVYGNVE